VRFGDVVENLNETERNPMEKGIERFIGLEHIEPGSPHIRSWGKVIDGTTFTRRCRPGQVLFGKRRAYQRKAAVAEFDAVVSGDIYVFAPKNNELLPELLPFLCMSERFFQHAVGTSAGSLSPRTNWKHLAEFEFDLPSIEQQRRISKILIDVDRAAEAVYNACQQILALRKAAHHELFMRGLNGSGLEARDKELPNGWRMSTIGESAIIENQLRKPINSAKRATMKGEYPYFGPTGILDYINEYQVEGEYVLIGEDGDHFLKFDTWNMTQLIRGRFNVNNHAHLLRGTEICRTEWIFQYFKHRNITPYLSRQGSGRLKLQKSVLEIIPIVIPPLQEQDSILDFLRCIDAVLLDHSAHVETANSILQSLTNELLG